ncbi:hypothetical protein [Empedobacter sedimenti]|uniref:hypothetical protein n=1 Tax=Empedobacter sedimenti TaxID=3042610 RepID=UPI0024A65964|nr:hypothetical protein [Empedobacter sedimenti]
MSDNIVQCSNHGEQTLAFVCHHLVGNAENIGFHEFEVEDQDNPDAWCDACHEQWQHHNQTEEEQEKWESLVDFKILCHVCYHDRKARNTKPLSYDLAVLNTTEILQQLQKKEFEKLDVPNFLPAEYAKLLPQIETQLISIECKLLSYQDALEINKTDTEWIFATSIGQEYWTFNDKGEIVFYEMIDEELTPKTLKISFNEWLQLAFLFKKLDQIQQKYLVTIQLKELLETQLHLINPSLVEPFKNYI